MNLLVVGATGRLRQLPANAGAAAFDVDRPDRFALAHAASWREEAAR